MSCPKHRCEVDPGCKCHLHSSARGFTKKDHWPKAHKNTQRPAANIQVIIKGAFLKVQAVQLFSRPH